VLKNQTDIPLADLSVVNDQKQQQKQIQQQQMQQLQQQPGLRLALTAPSASVLASLPVDLTSLPSSQLESVGLVYRGMAGQLKQELKQRPDKPDKPVKKLTEGITQKNKDIKKKVKKQKKLRRRHSKKPAATSQDPNADQS